MKGTIETVPPQVLKPHHESDLWDVVPGKWHLWVEEFWSWLWWDIWHELLPHCNWKPVQAHQRRCSWVPALRTWVPMTLTCPRASSVSSTGQPPCQSPLPSHYLLCVMVLAGQLLNDCGREGERRKEELNGSFKVGSIQEVPRAVLP